MEECQPPLLKKNEDALARLTYQLVHLIALKTGLSLQVFLPAYIGIYVFSDLDFQHSKLLVTTCLPTDN